METRAKVVSSAAGHEATVATDGAAKAIALPAKAGGGSGVNGGELLMLAIATCYCNDLYREAAKLGIRIDGVEVEAYGEFKAPGAPAANVGYRAKVRSDAPEEALASLLRETDKVAEVHRSLRAGTYVAFDRAVARPRIEAAPADAGAVTLREITADTVRGVLRLSVAPGQDHFVASNAVSLSQALFSPYAWYRAAYRGDELVGFVMVSDDQLKAEPPPKPEMFLWRLMVDQRYQGQGIGRAIVHHVADLARSRGYERLLVSWVPSEGGPEPFYRGLGFVPTGEVDDGEVVAALELGSPPSRG